MKLWQIKKRRMMKKSMKNLKMKTMTSVKGIRERLNGKDTNRKKYLKMDTQVKLLQIIVIKISSEIKEIKLSIMKMLTYLTRVQLCKENSNQIHELKVKNKKRLVKKKSQKQNMLRKKMNKIYQEQIYKSLLTLQMKRKL